MKTYTPECAALYAALWAYGSETLSLGGTEGVYRVVAALGSEVAHERTNTQTALIVDLGCGVGRLVRDLAKALPNATVYGFDRSSHMIAIARTLLESGEALGVDLTSRGFPFVRVKTTPLANIKLYCLEGDGDDEVISSLRGSCDLVVSLNTVERTDDVDAYAQLAASLVREGGAFILASSMNWLDASSWSRFPDFDALLKYFTDLGSFQIERTIERIPYFETHDRNGSGEYFNVNVAQMRRRLPNARSCE